MYPIKWTKNVVYDPDYPQECLLELCEPDVSSKVPLLIFLHGGGLTSGSYLIGEELACMAQEYGIAVASVEYRKYPNAAYPDFIVDAARAVAWMCCEWNIKERYSAVYLGGSSAGAYLSMMLYFARHFLQNEGVDSLLFDGCIFNAGQPTSHFQVLTEKGMDGRCVRIDQDAPLWYVSQSFAAEKTVPLLILAADNDMVNRLEQNMMFKTALLHFDYPESQIEMKVMKGYRHCQYDKAKNENGQYVLASIMADFIHSRSAE